VNTQIKKVAAVHDLSGYGRSSLMAIIPTLSAMGIQVCPLPTAILSNHTGGFEHYSYVDLTDSMTDYIAVWKELGLSFDCIYSGFLGSVGQIDIISDFIDHFSTADNLVVVDPVMGDNGQLYSSFGEDIVPSMRRLIAKANIITPNFTEAAFLLGESCSEKDFSDKKAKEWLRRLCAFGSGVSVITSAPDASDSGNTSVVAYDSKNDTFWKVGCRYIPAAYPGTGDIFTSVMIGSLLQGDSLPVALDRGVQFISQCIKASYGFNYPKRNGVLLEKELDILKMPVLISGYELL